MVRPRRDPRLVLPDARDRLPVGRTRLVPVRPARSPGRQVRGYKVIPTLADQWGECGTRVDADVLVQDRGLVHGRLHGARPGPCGRPWRRLAELPRLGRRGRHPLQGRSDDRVLAAHERGRGQPGRRVRRLPAGRRAARRARSPSRPTVRAWSSRSIPTTCSASARSAAASAGRRARSTRTSTRSPTSTCASTTTTRPTRRSRATSSMASAFASSSAPSSASRCSSARPGSARSTSAGRSRTGQVALTAKICRPIRRRNRRRRRLELLAGRLDARQLRHRPGRPGPQGARAIQRLRHSGRERGRRHRRRHLQREPLQPARGDQPRPTTAAARGHASSTSPSPVRRRT